MPELISILMPVKDGAPFLPECLDSIQNQSVSNWELIIVDDHSTDGSVGLIEKYVVRDSRIKIYHNSEFGIPNALKLAFNQSNGTFITRMDCDDLMHPKKLELLSSRLNAGEEHSVSICMVEYFSTNNLGEGYLKYAAWLNDLTVNERNFTEIYKECVVPSCASMVRRGSALAYQLFDDLEVPEDYDFCFRLYKKFELLTVPEALHLWRDHPKRVTRTDNEYDIKEFGLFKLRKFLEIEINTGDTLVLWGCGGKGKQLARYMLENGVQFQWISENSRKIGVDIYGVIIQSFKIIKNTRQLKLIISVSNPTEQSEISLKLQNLSFVLGKDYFFFF